MLFLDIRSRLQFPRRTRQLGAAALLLSTYFVLDRVSYLFPLNELSITPWNPLAGFSVFLIMYFGSGFSVLLFIGRIIGDMFVRGEPAGLVVTPIGALIITAGYVFTAKILLLVKDWAVDAPTFRAVGTHIVGILVAVIPTGLAYVAMLYLLGRINSDAILDSLLRRYVGDVTGIMTSLPALLTLAHRLKKGVIRQMLPSRTNVIQALLVVAVVGFLIGIRSIDEFKFFYLLFLPMIWIAAQGGFSAAAFGVLWTQVTLITVICLVGYYTGTGATDIQILMTTLSVTGLMLGTVVSERQVAELRLVEAQTKLHESGKRAASGELATMIAHELNQPLTAIINYARSSQLIAQQTGDPTLLNQTLAKTMAQANRAGEIVRHLREFISCGNRSPEAFSINGLAYEVLKLVMPPLKMDGIQLRIEFIPDLNPVFAERLQIFQVLDNLLRNAIDAMAANANRPKILTVRTSSCELGDIIVSVSDTGSGIPAAMADCVFTPFVTTKATGMGLGLAICKTIITAHEGRLWYEASPGGGTVFAFTLPPHIDGEDHVH